MSGPSSEIPRRMVAGDSEFKLWAGWLRVMVGGNDVTHICCGYDLDEGTVLIHVRDREGRILRNGGTTLKATITGDVHAVRK